MCTRVCVFEGEFNYDHGTVLVVENAAASFTTTSPVVRKYVRRTQLKYEPFSRRQWDGIARQQQHHSTVSVPWAPTYVAIYVPALAVRSWKRAGSAIMFVRRVGLSTHHGSLPMVVDCCGQYGTRFVGWVSSSDRITLAIDQVPVGSGERVT